MNTTPNSTPLESIAMHIDDHIALEAGELPRMHHLGTSETGQKDRFNMADNIAVVAANTRVGLLMEPAAATLYNAAVALSEDNSPLGHVLLLDALIASPHATQAMLRRLRAELVECDPALALLGPACHLSGDNVPVALRLRN